MAACFDAGSGVLGLSTGPAHGIALTALFGYAISYLPFAAAFWIGFGHGPYVLLLGLIGAVPSAVCSWLAAERQVPDLVPSP